MTTKTSDSTNINNTAANTVLDEPTREFVRLALGAGLVVLDDLKKIVVSLLNEGGPVTRDRLADGLVGAGMLTDWQTKKLFAGRGRGFFLGSYKLLRPIGKGGMGVVYLGEHKVMKRLMALKILSTESAGDAARIARFQSEAQAAAQLDHPNIVRAYDFSEDNGRFFIAMEYIEGIDLQVAVQRDGVMSIEAALDAMKQAARGLAHAHGRGIVHRDIKPANLLLRNDGVLKISDMGLARIGWQGEAPNKAGRSRLLGTSEFLAPEQAMDSRAVDGRADVYSLGCTLYFLLTGKPPFPAETQEKRIAKHQTAAIPDLTRERKDCPPAIATIAKRMMAKRPEERIPSAGELLAQLNRITLSPAMIAARQPLTKIATSTDTVASGTLYQDTLSDSSLGGEGVDEVVLVDENSLFDFADLPAVQLPKGALRPVAQQNPAVRPLQPVAPMTAPWTAPVPKPKNTRDDNQQLMLGIGLAVAFLALLAVVGIGLVIALKPEEKAAPKIKATESEDGKSIIVIGE